MEYDEHVLPVREIFKVVVRGILLRVLVCRVIEEWRSGRGSSRKGRFNFTVNLTGVSIYFSLGNRRVNKH